MKKNAGPKVVAPKNLPLRLPFVSTAVIWLSLDRIGAPGWAWGGVCTIWICVWIGTIVHVWRQREIDLFPEDTQP